jgi:hypothetical protein
VLSLSVSIRPSLMKAAMLNRDDRQGKALLEKG